MSILARGAVATAVFVNRRRGDSGDDANQGNALENAIDSFDNNHDGKVDASEMTAILRGRGEETTDRLRVFDEDGDGTLDGHEVGLAKGTEDVFNRVYVLRALAKKYKAAASTRAKYLGVLSHLLFMSMLFTLLALQMRPDDVFEVTKILSSLQPGSGRLSSVDELMSWLSGFITPAWSDPLCGDNVCVAPNEFAGFGRFGCAPDCGNAENLTRVTVEMEANFVANAYFDSVTDQPLFLSSTAWNLCSSSHLIDDSPICWYETDRKFTAPKQTVSDTLDLPDGSWELRITAPLGGVRGEVLELGKAADLDFHRHAQKPVQKLLLNYCNGTDAAPAAAPSASPSTVTVVAAATPPAPAAGRRMMLSEGTSPACQSAADVRGGRQLLQAPPDLGPATNTDIPPDATNNNNNKPTYASPDEIFVSLKTAAVFDKLVTTNYHDYGGRSCTAGSRVVLLLYANGPAWEQYQIQIVRPWSTTLVKPAGTPLCYDECGTASNGVCEDGGPGDATFRNVSRNATYLSPTLTQGADGYYASCTDGRCRCPYGGDCGDCGPRPYTLLPSAPGVRTDAGAYNLTANERGVGGVKLNVSQAVTTASEWMAFDLCVDPSDEASSISNSSSTGRKRKKRRRSLLEEAQVSLLLRLGDSGDYTDRSDDSFGWDGGAVSIMDESGCLLVPPTGMDGPETKEKPPSDPSATDATERKSVSFALPQSGQACTRSFPGLSDPEVRSKLESHLGFKNMLAVDVITTHTPSANASDPPSCPTGLVLLNLLISAEPNSTTGSSGIFEYDEPPPEVVGNGKLRPTGAPVVDVETLSGALTNMTVRADVTDSWKARAWDPWVKLTAWCAAPGSYRLRAPDTASGSILIAAGVEGCQVAAASVTRNVAVHDAYETSLADFLQGKGTATTQPADPTVTYTIVEFTVSADATARAVGCVKVLDNGPYIAAAAPSDDAPATCASGEHAVRTLFRGGPISSAASNVGWRIEAASTASDGTSSWIPTRVMRQGVYLTAVEVQEDVCLPPGEYRVVSVDDNEAGAGRAHASIGWDGGALHILAAPTAMNAASITENVTTSSSSSSSSSGAAAAPTCLLGSVGFDLTNSTYEKSGYFKNTDSVVVTAAGVVALNGVNVSAGGASCSPLRRGEGSCTYAPEAVSLCGAHDRSSTDAGVTKYSEMCSGVCASHACHLPSFLAAGPTPSTAGCCHMNTGQVGGSFSLNNFGQTRYILELSESDTRERFLGVSNRVVAGVLVHTTRASTEGCVSSRFAHLTGPECSSGSDVDLSPYGVDPVFLRTSGLFDRELSVEYAKFHGIKSYGRISNFTEDCSPPSCGTHYAADEVNERGAPYGFFHEKLEGYDDGFAVFFDVNANEEQATNLLSYMKDGFFVDDQTRTIQVSTVTYNAGLGVFSYFHCAFDFHPGGSIITESQVQTLSVENYKGDLLDNIRAVFEMLFLIITFHSIVVEFREIWACFRKTRGVSGYFRSAWNYIDVSSIALQIVCISLWGHLNFEMADSFSVASRYKVYADFKADARFLRLSNGGEGLRTVASKFAEVAEMIDVLVTYNTLFGLNLILLLAIFLKNVDFQPRLGVVTRTLMVALTDLSHFFVVLSVVFVAYSAIGYILFGGQLEVFSTIRSTMENLFNWMAIGDQGETGDVFQLTGTLLYAGILYYVSYTVVMCMILLNFLLGIIIDSFIEVKERFQSSLSVPTELAELARSSLNVARRKSLPDGEMSRRLDAAADEELKRHATVHPELNAHHLDRMYKVHAMNVDPDMTEDIDAEEVVTAAKEREPGGGGCKTRVGYFQQDHQLEGDGAVVKLGAAGGVTYTAQEIAAVLDDSMKVIGGAGLLPGSTRQNQLVRAMTTSMCARSANAVDGSDGRDLETAATRFPSPIAGAVMRRFGHEADDPSGDHHETIRKRQHGDVMQLLAQTLSMVEKVASEVADVKKRVSRVEKAIVAADLLHGTT